MLRSFSVLAIGAGVALARPAPALVARQDAVTSTSSSVPDAASVLASALSTFPSITPSVTPTAVTIDDSTVTGAVTVGDILNQKAVVVDSETVSLDPSNCVLTSFSAVHTTYTLTAASITESINVDAQLGCLCDNTIQAGLYTSIAQDGVRSVFCATGVTTGATAVSTSVPTGTPGDPNNGAWAQVSCDTTPLDDVASDPQDQWDVAGASAAWTDVTEAYAGQNVGDLSLSNFIFNFFHARPFPNCDKLDNANCDVTINCGESAATGQPVTSPAGYLITNSMVSLHWGLDQFRTSVGLANDYVQGYAGNFVSTFSPIVDEIADQKNFRLFLDGIQGAFVLGFAPFFQGYLQGLKFFKDHPSLYGTTGDLTYNLAGTASAAIKDSLPQLSTTDAQNNLTAYLAKTAESWYTATSALAEDWYSNPDTLGNLIANGQVFDLNNETTNTDGIADIMKKAMFASALPLVWAYNTDGMKPFIATSDGIDGGCADAEPTNDFDDAVIIKINEPATTWDDTKICDGDTAYWLIGGDKYHYTGVCRIQDGVDCDKITKDGVEVAPLRGWNTLDGSQWGGLTKDDVFFNALNNWKANGNKNVAASLDLSTQEAITGLIDLDLTKAKGLVSIPVCGLEEAAANAKNGLDTNNVFWPCNAS